MEQLESMKETLTGCVQAQLCNLQAADYHELGAAIDMIKDLCEAIYYCTITEAMEEKDEAPRYYYPMMDYNMNYREADRQYGRMYYNGDGSSSSSSGTSNSGSGTSSSNNNRGNDARGGGTRGFYEGGYPELRLDMRDSREGKSPMSRRSYMESKEMHHPKEVKMKELERYMQELGHDLTEMIADASPEEKQMLQKKIAALATKLDV